MFRRRPGCRSGSWRLAWAADKSPAFKISLAQWSLHRALFGKQLDNLDFAKVAKADYGIEAVEYVNQFFKDRAKDEKYLAEMKMRAGDLGVTSVLIMIDGEGNLGDPNAAERTKAVENHYKWVEAAKYLGCHSIRVNAASAGSYEEQQKLSIDGLRRLALMVTPEGRGGFRDQAWEALSKVTGREHAHLALYREDEKIRFRDVQAQPRKIISSPTWSGLESEKVSYNAGYTNVHELIPWRTLTGRQQFYMDHPWMIAFGEGFSTYRPPVDLKATTGIHNVRSNGNPEILLNFITPHQKWGIHSTYTDNLLMLTLSRGGPCIWLSEDDAKRAGIVDNDWVELFNVNGAIAARAVVSQRVNPGMVLMYHAQEKIVNTPGSEITGVRGGIHNSVTRVVLKPTHMIGGYAQFAYGFNYYGTIGTNRDEFVIVRKMAKVDWLDTPRDDQLAPVFQSQGESP